MPFSQRSRALYKGLQRPEGANKRAYTKGEAAEVHEEGRFQQIMDASKGQHEGSQRDEDQMPFRPQSAIGEIKTITKGPST